MDHSYHIQTPQHHRLKHLVDKNSKNFAHTPDVDIEDCFDSIETRRHYLYECTFCKKNFHKNITYKRHLASHTKEWPEVCEVCGKGFVKKQEVERHHQSKHAEDIERISCPMCDKKLRPGSMKGHLNIHLGEKPELKFSCELCDKKFHRKSEMDCHTAATHNGPKNYKCLTCGSCFPSVKYLKKHEKTHILGSKFLCTFCMKTYASKATLYGHQRLVHAECMPYECSICEERFGYPHLLKDHLAIHKTGKARHVCKHCNKRFKNWSTLRGHLHIHSTELKYNCEVCSRVFANKVKYIRHLSCHKGPFECNVCKQELATKSALKNHQKCRRHEVTFLSLTAEEQESELFS